MSRHAVIDMPDLVFAYELYSEGLTWKCIERHTGHQKSTIIKSLRRAGACMRKQTR